MPSRWMRSEIVIGRLVQKCKCLCLCDDRLFHVIFSKELDASLAQLNAEHVDVLVSHYSSCGMFRISPTNRVEPAGNGQTPQRGDGRRTRALQTTVGSIVYGTASAETYSFCLLAMQKPCIRTRTPCRPIGSPKHK